ncbi:hypothetical protein VSK91_10030 [Bacillus swezeyi]|uniref:Uncharacterized protein n=1 Tax=Bacillus swezeyi TaxID=1925020 RepID=A0A5M8RRA8_9BACI|nr:hypothetical protein [Bacillus swezeyi]KAA6451095.1 hypothetical protein DX927_09770 [Bacillus swezeyi]TYS37570.1 hypothetical protein FZC77_09220 [Bacillus swezeyi]
MKGLISFMKLWAAVLLNWVMPVRESQVKALTSAGITYQQAEAFSGGFSEAVVEKEERSSKYQRERIDGLRKDRIQEGCKKAVKRVRAGPALYMCA